MKKYLSDKNYFQAKPYKPFHLSFGVVPILENGKVLCHYWKELNENKDIYHLMRETSLPGEYFEETIKRGLLEEMGAKGTISAYVGSLVATDEWFGEIDRPVAVEKTTLYFLVRVDSYSESLRLKEDWENMSELVEMDIEEMTEKVKKQTQKYKIEIYDERKILKAATELLSNKEFLETTK